MRLGKMKGSVTARAFDGENAAAFREDQVNRKFASPSSTTGGLCLATWHIVAPFVYAGTRNHGRQYLNLQNEVPVVASGAGL
jgi:hypothetical protein